MPVEAILAAGAPLADADAVLEHPLVAAVAAGLILSLVGLAARVAARLLRLADDLEEDVLPHFRTPGPDDTEDHSLPGRLRALEHALRNHMAEEDRLRAADLADRRRQARHRAERERRIDELLARLAAGNPEVRPTDQPPDPN